MLIFYTSLRKAKMFYSKERKIKLPELRTELKW